MNRHENHEAVVAALRANPGPLVEWAAVRMIALGAKSEWSMEDNFCTTEGLAEMAGQYALPSVGNQTRDALRFYGLAAQSLYFDADIDDDLEDES